MAGEFAPSPGVRRAATVPSTLHGQVEYQTTFRGNCPRCSPQHNETSALLNLTQRPVEIFCQVCQLRLLSIDASDFETFYDGDGNVINVNTRGNVLPLPFSLVVRRTNTGSSTMEGETAPTNHRQTDTASSTIEGPIVSSETGNGSLYPDRGPDRGPVSAIPEPTVNVTTTDAPPLFTQTYNSPSGTHIKEIDDVARELKKKRHRTCSRLKWFCNKHILKRFGWQMQLIRTNSPTRASLEPDPNPPSQTTEEQRSPPRRPSQDISYVGGAWNYEQTPTGGLHPTDIPNSNGGSTARNSTSRSETVVPDSEPGPEHGQGRGAADDTQNVRFASGCTPPRHNSCSRRSSGKPESTAPLSSRTGTNDSLGDIASDKATGRSDTTGEPPSLVYTDTATSTDGGDDDDDPDDGDYREREFPSLEQQLSRREEDLRGISMHGT